MSRSSTDTIQNALLIKPAKAQCLGGGGRQQGWRGVGVECSPAAVSTLSSAKKSVEVYSKLSSYPLVRAIYPITLEGAIFYFPLRCASFNFFFPSHNLQQPNESSSQPRGCVGWEEVLRLTPKYAPVDFPPRLVFAFAPP